MTECKRSRSVFAWLLVAVLSLSVPVTVMAQPTADPAVWGIYARLVDTEFAGNGDWASWRWGPDDTIVEGRAILAKTVIRPGARAGELVSVYGGGLHTFDGRIGPDGSVTWIRRGSFLKMPSRVSIVDGQYVEEALKLDKDDQIVRVTKTLRFEQKRGPSVATAAGEPVLASVVPSAAAPAVALPEPAPNPPPPAAPPAPAPAPVASPTPPKSGPRTLSQAELATLQQRIQTDRARRAQALSQEQAAAEQQRQQLEQMQHMAALEEEYWEEEAPAPAPNLAAVFLNTLGSEMAKNQAERDAQDAFIRDVQRQQAMAIERRQREEERQRREAERVRLQASAQAAAPAQRAPSAAEVAQQAERTQAAEARERQLAEQAAAERARQQQLRAQRQPAVASTPVVPGPPSTEAAAKPLRFVLSIGLLNKPGDTVNPMCYSNVITSPGPPGRGAPGFMPTGSGQQAHDIVQSFKAAFIARCRASGREIISDGHFNYAWNQSQGSEAGMQEVRPRHREDVLVSL